MPPGRSSSADRRALSRGGLDSSKTQWQQRGATLRFRNYVKKKNGASLGLKKARIGRKQCIQGLLIQSRRIEVVSPREADPELLSSRTEMKA